MKEETLDIKIKERDMLFDPYVLGPHVELRSEIFAVVDRYVKPLGGGTKLNVNIYGADIGEAAQEKVREAFREHYEDELRAAKKSLTRWRLEVAILAIGGAMGLVGWFSLASVYHDNLFLELMSIVGTFCVWKIGDLLLNRNDFRLAVDKLRMERDAVIEFY